MASKDEIRQMQLESLWKWRWLGFRNSTPAFKASLALCALGAAAIVVVPLLRA